MVAGVARLVHLAERPTAATAAEAVVGELLVVEAVALREAGEAMPAAAPPIPVRVAEEAVAG